MRACVLVRACVRACVRVRLCVRGCACARARVRDEWVWRGRVCAVRACV